MTKPYLIDLRERAVGALLAGEQLQSIVTVEVNGALGLIPDDKPAIILTLCSAKVTVLALQIPQSMI